MLPGIFLVTQLFLCYHFRIGFTFSEVVDVLEDDTLFQSANVFLMPPGDGDKSDEDSDNEEGANIEQLSPTL